MKRSSPRFSGSSGTGPDWQKSEIRTTLVRTSDHRDAAMDERHWTAVTSMRLAVADLLEELEPAEWERPSLCAGGRVRDVAGHVSLVPTVTTWELLRAAPRAGFDPNRINTRLAR